MDDCDVERALGRIEIAERDELHAEVAVDVRRKRV